MAISFRRIIKRAGIIILAVYRAIITVVLTGFHADRYQIHRFPTRKRGNHDATIAHEIIEIPLDLDTTDDLCPDWKNQVSFTLFFPLSICHQ
jgi:hypothetical protein